MQRHLALADPTADTDNNMDLAERIAVEVSSIASHINAAYAELDVQTRLVLADMILKLSWK